MTSHGVPESHVIWAYHLWQLSFEPIIGFEAPFPINTMWDQVSQGVPGGVPRRPMGSQSPMRFGLIISDNFHLRQLLVVKHLFQ